MYEASEYVGRALEQSVEGAFFFPFPGRTVKRLHPKTPLKILKRTINQFPLLPKTHKYELQRLGLNPTCKGCCIKNEDCTLN